MHAPALISEAARRAGITVHQVRTYVSAGLVKPCAATPGGYFLFDEACMTRLRIIGAATRAGLCIREIADLVRALGVNDRQALRAARRSVSVAIASRRATLQQLHELVSDACGTDSSEASS